MARPQISLDENYLVKRYLDGASSRDLAKEFNVNRNTIMSRLKKHVNIEFNLGNSVRKSAK
ncbi:MULTISPECIES: hypothetical protein [Dehalobacter]|uniref:hypothetical protein n=1 Tax=Dehalobacter TaxID=56112 RepID=UPI000367D2A2|nr:hypothetical protein [Dehalobacter sp.]MDJ0304562.1 hypothetical protein [Dehalobacter sp.]